LIDRGANVTTVASNGETALHCAIHNKDTRIIPFLIGKGCNVRAQADDNCTPLHHACKHGSLEVVKVLIENGADIAAEARTTLLDCAAHKFLQNTFKICNKCLSPGILRCGACKSMLYCSQECQKKDWPDHKVLCKKL
jgi:ankyrin repeat protein